MFYQKELQSCAHTAYNQWYFYITFITVELQMQNIHIEHLLNKALDL